MSERNQEAMAIAHTIAKGCIITQATERFIYQIVEACSECERAIIAAKDAEIARLQDRVAKLEGKK